MFTHICVYVCVSILLNIYMNECSIPDINSFKTALRTM